jgi:hypothetical protein
MHCPNCGTVSSDDQKFCRVCGIGLEEFSRVLVEKRPVLHPQRGQSRGWAEKLGIGFFGLFLALLYFAIFWGVIDGIIIGKKEVVGGILFLVAMPALSLGGSLASSPRETRTRRAAYKMMRATMQERALRLR